MVKGINRFREWFQDYKDHYVIMGGSACDLLMTEAGADFRATKDIDLVLIVEAINADFCMRFWDFVNTAGYERRNKSSGEPQFYRFEKPKQSDYPVMIELFSRRPDVITLPEDAHLTPIPTDEEISSLSAILLNNDYYEFLKQGRENVTELMILDALHLIPFKAKAWIDLSSREGDVDSKDIRKHKNDVFRLTGLLNPEQERPKFLPETVRNDMRNFIEGMYNEDINLKQFGIRGRTKEEILAELMRIYGE